MGDCQIRGYNTKKLHVKIYPENEFGFDSQMRIEFNEIIGKVNRISALFVFSRAKFILEKNISIHIFLFS